MSRQRIKIRVCSICGREFGDRETIRQHMAAHHPKNNEFCCVAKCEQCGKLVEFKGRTMKEARAKADQGECCGIPFIKRVKND